MLYGNLISQRRSGTTSFYLFDGLGSTTQLANSTGSVTDSYLYDSFGNILLTSGTTTNYFRYVGRLGYRFSEDLNQYLLVARGYSPTSGRFVARDPLGVQFSDWNLYRYVKNSPAHSSIPQDWIGSTIFGLASSVSRVLTFVRPQNYWAWTFLHPGCQGIPAGSSVAAGEPMFVAGGRPAHTISKPNAPWRMRLLIRTRWTAPGPICCTGRIGFR